MVNSDRRSSNRDPHNVTIEEDELRTLSFEDAIGMRRNIIIMIIGLAEDLRPTSVGGR